MIAELVTKDDLKEELELLKDEFDNLRKTIKDYISNEYGHVI